MAPLHFGKATRSARLLLATALSAALVLGVAYAGSVRTAQDSPHLKMGNPSHATADEGDKNNFLMTKKYFALSYNNEKGTPNWVSWRLGREDLGNAPRKPFHPDDDLPDGFKIVTPKDYIGSGFDRGHMCPHSDRNSDDDASLATFVMTNMVPQSPQNNQKAWNQLEMYLRDLVKNEGKVCYVIAGPEGKGGVGRNGLRTTTKNKKVVVPSHTWKVVMVLDEDVEDPSQLKANTPIRLIGVVVPNDDRVGFDWSGFRVPVSEIEELTGFVFFDKVPSVVMGDHKELPDEVPIPPPSPVIHDNGQ